MAKQNNNKVAEQKKQDVNQLLKVRRENLQNLQANGKDPFPDYKVTIVTHHSSMEVKELYDAHEAEILEKTQKDAPDVEGLDEDEARGPEEQDYEDYNERREIMDAKPIEVAIAGRMMFKRVMGKASFCNIQDLKGNIQVYVARDAISEKTPMQISRNLISVISSVWKALLSEQEQAKSLSMQKDDSSFKELPDSSGEIPWTDRYRYALSSEICRPYHESGQQERIYQTFPDSERNP